MQLGLADTDHFAAPCCLDCSEMDQQQQLMQGREDKAVVAAGPPLAGGVEPSAHVPAAAATAGGPCGTAAPSPAPSLSPGGGGGGSGAAAMRQPPGVGGMMALGCGEEGEFRPLQELFDDWACTADGEV